MPGPDDYSMFINPGFMHECEAASRVRDRHRVHANNGSVACHLMLHKGWVYKGRGMDHE